MKMYKHLSYSTLLFILLVHGNLAIEHCPALSLNFADFGIEGCPPSFTVNSPEEVEEFLKAATCLGWGKWTLRPSIGCSSPVIPEGVVLEYPCYCDFGGKCVVKCLPRYELEGKKFIECQRDGTWTSFPRCTLRKCIKPELPASLEFAEECDFSEGKQCNLKCSGDGYRIDGSVSYILCKDLKWSSFPHCHRFCDLNKIPQWLVAKDDCVGNSKENCPIKCRNEKHTLIGEHYIQCLESGEWTTMPVCGCAAILVPENIVFRQSCTFAAGVSCQAVCAPSYYKKGDVSVLICDENGVWNLATSIKCLKMCPELVLPDGLEITNKCRRRYGDVCNVRCKSDLMRRTGPESFQCLPSGKYSTMPGCAKVDQCSDTVLPDTVKFVGNCRYTYGETCSVGCKESSFVLKGSSSITCTSSGTWTDIPDCVKYCPELRLKPNQEFTKNAICGKEVGDTCSVSCKKNYYPTAPIVAKCLPEQKWTELPDCQKMCDKPKLEGKVMSMHHCERSVGSVCTLGCQEKRLVITPTDKITCLKGAVWSEIPKCRFACKLENLPSNFKLVNCPQIFENEECELRCADSNEKVYGGRMAQCRRTGLFIPENVKCVSECKQMTLPAGLKPANNREECNYMKPGESCTVKCENSLAILTGSEKITCLGNNKFSPFPSCELICKAQKLPRNTRIVGSCDNHDGAVCIVRCERRKYYPNGTHYFATYETVCQNGAWTTVPKCEISCPPLKIHETVQLSGKCEMKNNARCSITCKVPGALMYGTGIVNCKNEKWNGEDAYCVEVCGHPHLPPHLEISPDYPCTHVVKTECKVVCETPYVLIGRDAITCESSSQWSSFPKCVQLCPQFEHPISLLTTCDRMPNSECQYYCAEGYVPSSPYGNILTCYETGVWNFQPECEPEKKHCVLPEYLEATAGGCSYGVYCAVQCVDKFATVLGDLYVMCNAEGNFTALPSCISPDTLCPDPVEPDALTQYYCNRQPYKLFTTCTLRCYHGGNDYEIIGPKVIMCEPPGQWSSWGRCVKLCPLRVISYPHVIGKFCDRRPNTYCLFRCNEGLGNPRPMYCDEYSRWDLSSLDKFCKSFEYTCPVMPNIPEYFTIDMENIRSILLTCPAGYKLVGIPLFECVQDESNIFWTELPHCVPDEYPLYGPCEDIPGYSCSDKSFSRPCTLLDDTCPALTIKSSYCLSNGLRSSFVPRC